MELGTVLVGLGTLFVFIAPVMWLQWSQKNKNSSRVKWFKIKASDLGMEIEQVAVWSHNYCIGIDNKGSKLLYFNERQADELFVLIDLSAVKTCKLEVDSRKLSREGEQLVIIDRISLVFTFRNANTPSRSILIFDSNADPSITDQLQLARDWDERIASALKTLPQSVRRVKAAA